jgi:hypothetical protein
MLKGVYKSIEIKNKKFQCKNCLLYFDCRCGVVVGILAYHARGRGFDSRTVQLLVRMNMSVCIGSGCFYVYKYVFIRYLESITQAL